ncbi:hypothetical protein C9374_000558 [Naegleria lovaniensis]|uniref:Uncharacterized protein n=1 Tax=Naegleria lovaniensis TaxID=51637 RepID=A0AA88GYK7_NAELO|nr:uncharacterized protein C9374_000558 [Naegleria lovaniensis]KAG2388394.1 hypothetical protein C9374_000558 [Naegleria lovaniensis]
MIQHELQDLLARNEELQQLMQEQQIQYEREKCQHDFIETINAPYKHKKAIKKLIQRKYELESQNIKFKSLFSLIRNAKSKEEIDQVLNIKELQETSDTLKHDEKINTIPVPTISTPTTNTIVMMPSKCSSYSPKSSSTTATPSPRSSHFATSPSFSRTSACPTTTNKFQHKKNIHDTSLPSSCVIQSPKHIETTASSNMITDLRNQLTKYKTKNQKLQEQVETWKNLVDMYEQMFGVVKVSSAELLEK